VSPAPPFVLFRILSLRFPIRFAVALATTVLAACSGTRIVDALTPSSAYVATTDIAYGDGPRRKLDVYVPAALAPGAKAPVVVFFYGGSWRFGEKADYRFVGTALAAKGIIAVIADYRLFPEVSYPEFLVDTAQAVAWTHREIARYGGDVDRIFIAGHSAGAYDAAMVAFDPRWLAPYGLKPSQFRGFVGLAGPYNFLPIVDEGVKEVFHWPDTPPDSQPINHVTKDSLPSLLIAAKKDTFVYPEQNTEPMGARLKSAGVDATVIEHGGVNHVTLMGSMARPLRFLAPVEREFTEFVLSH
jgi:acetyl esterase/lipase